MPLFFDGIHLISDCDLGELHQFAKRVGLKREWFQDKRVPHYDVFGGIKDRVEKAIGKCSTRALIKKAKGVV